MKLLSIDYSTTCTGYAVFNNSQLIKYGFIKNKCKKHKNKLINTINKLEWMAQEVLSIVQNEEPNIIVIEEIAGSKQRLGQKTLDMGHGFMLKALEIHLEKVIYYDVTGANGWRTNLQLKLSDADKLQNKESKKLNKQLQKGIKKLPIIGPKHLSARFVNDTYGLNLDVDNNPSDNDVADSIAMGTAFLRFKM